MSGENVVAHAGVARVTADARSPGIGVELPPPEPGVKRGATLSHRGKSGRPPLLTTIVDDEQLRAPIREMRAAHVRRITQPTVQAWSGFTLAEIRGYLKVTHRTWAEFLRSF